MTATDHQGRPITPAHIESMRRVNQSIPARLEREESLRVSYELDEVWRSAHPEDGDIYALILPSSDFHEISYVPQVGEIFTCAKECLDEHGQTIVLKRFLVVSIDREVGQSVGRLDLYLTVSVIPVEDGAGSAQYLLRLCQEFSQPAGINHLLHLCALHGLYVQMNQGYFLVALGDFIGQGGTLTEAIKHWCQEVERRGLTKREAQP